MKYGKIVKLLFVAALVFAAAAFGQDVKFVDQVSEASAEIKDEDLAGAREVALARAKREAIISYAGSLLPPGLVKQKKDDVARIAAHYDKYVVSWEALEETREDDTLKVRVSVRLDEGKLKGALKSAGLLYGRAYPAVMMVVKGSLGESDLNSAWDKLPGQRAEPNACEAVLGRPLLEYGLDVVLPDTPDPGADTKKISAPRDEQQKEQVYNEVRDKYGAGILVVGRAEEKTPSVVEGDSLNPAGGMTPHKVVLRVAAADTRTQDVFWHETYEEEVEEGRMLAAQKTLDGLCAQSGADLVEVLFERWSAQPVAGVMREVVIEVEGFERYDQAMEFQKVMAREGPGVTEASLTRMSHNKIEFTVMTDVSAARLIEWIEGNTYKDARLTVTESDELLIRARAKTEPEG